MGKHQLPFELVFKRGGERPQEKRTWHTTQDAAESAARDEAERQQAQGHTDVWLAYDVWDHRGPKAKRIVHSLALQTPKKR